MTREIIITFLVTAITMFWATDIANDFSVSKKVYQMGVCMEEENSDMLRCRLMVDVNYKGTNADK